MMRQLGPGSDEAAVSPRLLEARSGLTRHTVLRGLARLEAAGWLRAAPGSQSAPAGWASVPGDLLLDRRVGCQAKLLYGSLQLLPGFRGPSGQFTHAQLSGLIRVNPRIVRSAVRALADRGWLQISQRNKFSPIHFTLGNPVNAGRERAAAEAAWRLAEAPYLGEALMREYLSLVVDSDEYEDNATPGFLVNPFTGEEMQFDRYYPPRAAFEFNGSQRGRCPQAAGP